LEFVITPPQSSSRRPGFGQPVACFQLVGTTKSRLKSVVHYGSAAQDFIHATARLKGAGMSLASAVNQAFGALMSFE
jgi:hypothetical protein